jgi:hypothetical protein
VADMVKRLVDGGVRVRGVEFLRPTLEALYLETVRREESPYATKAD